MTSKAPTNADLVIPDTQDPLAARQHRIERSELMQAYLQVLVMLAMMENDDNDDVYYFRIDDTQSDVLDV